jgi:hypothetical protein
VAGAQSKHEELQAQAAQPWGAGSPVKPCVLGAPHHGEQPNEILNDAADALLFSSAADARPNIIVILTDDLLGSRARYRGGANQTGFALPTF